MVQNENTAGTTADQEFAGKRVVVTGGSRGIGAAITQRLLEGGATVLATARKPTGDTPQGAQFVAADVATPEGVRTVADAALEGLGGVDVVVNNAGASGAYPGGSLTIGDEDWRHVLDINLLAAVRLNAALLPQMLERGSGAIVNISSSAAFLTPAPLLHYASAKAALTAYSKGLASEVAAKGVRVNTITPGNVTSPGADQLRADLAGAFGMTPADLTAGVPLGMGQPLDIAEAVAFLTSARARWITGADLVVDGGEKPTP